MFFRLALALSFLILPISLSAQQGKGLFFSVFGKDAPNTYGDFDNYQAFYFDLPLDETQPIYLRIFDPEVGGSYDEKHGEFNSESRFVVFGGESANHVYGATKQNKLNDLNFANYEIIFDRRFGSKRQGDGRWYSLLALPKEKGYDLNNGFVRFCLVVIGSSGDDGNFFDLALSYSETEKRPPSTTKTFVYDVSFRSPSLLLYDWEEFRGQIKLNTTNSSAITIHTFDMDDVPVSLSIPFLDDLDLATSGDGNWDSTKVELSQYNNPNVVGFNFYGRPFNNTFEVFATDENNNPIAIDLPILDYEPPTYPEISYKTSFTSSDCKTVLFETSVSNSDLISSIHTRWIIESDTLFGESISKSFDTTGYKSFIWEVKAYIGGGVQELAYQDSILINNPPFAWAGGNRSNIPNNSMAFDGTVSKDPDGKIAKYVWDFGDGTQGTGARIDKKYSEPGTYTVKLSVYDDSDTDCGVSTSFANVKINRPPVPSILAPEAVQLGELFTLDGTTSTDPDGEIIDYLWQIGTDTLMEGAVVHYALKTEESTKVTLQITDDSKTFNSSQRANFTIRVNKRPWASAGDDKVISPNRPATYSGRFSRDPDGEIIDYEWSFPNGQVLKGESVQHAFETPGTYKIALKVTDNTGKAFGYDSLSVLVNAPPVPVIKGNTIFNTGRIKLDASESYDPDGDIMDQFWIVNGNSVSGPVLVYGFDKPGEYSIQYTVIDNSGTYSAVQSADYTVIINDLPKPVIDVFSLAAPDEKITFSGLKSTDTDGKIEKYIWDFGDGSTGEGPTIDHEFIVPGVYQVSLSVQDDQGHEESVVITQKEIRINSRPFLSYTFPEKVTPGQSVEVDLSKSSDSDGKIVEYAYFLDNNWVIGEAKKTITINKNMSSLRVRVRDNSKQSNDTHEFEIPIVFNTSPVAIGNGIIRTSSPLVVFDGTKSFDPDGDELKYYWDFGDGKFTSSPVAIHKYKYGGSFKALLSVDDQRGLANSMAYDTVFVFVNRAPEPYVELPSILCVGDTMYYDATNTYEPDGGLLRFEWTFGDGTSAQGSKGKHVFETEGRYQVVLLVDDNEGMTNSVVTYSQSIDVVGAPEAFAGEDFTACVDELIQFNGKGSKSADESLFDYQWSFGDGNTSSGIDPQHLYDKPGKYKVTLSVSTNIFGACNSSNTDVLWVTVLPKPKAAFELPAIVRTGEEIVFDAQPSFIKGQEITRITWQIGEYETVTYTKVSKLDSDSTYYPVWQISSTRPLSVREETNKTALGLLPSFKRILPNDDYTIALDIETNSVSNCNSAQQVKYVSVKDRPQLAINKIPSLVPGIPFQFSGADMTSNVNDVKSAYWDFGDGTKKEGLYVTHTYTKPGTYSIVFLADDGSGDASAVTKLEKEIKVNAQPRVQFSGPERSLPNEVLTYDAAESYDEDGDITAYNWFFSDGTRLQGKTVSHSFKRNGNFMVTLSVIDDANAPNSLNSISKPIRVANATELSVSLPKTICPGQTINFISALSLPTNDTSKVQLFIGSSKISFKNAQNFTFNFPGTYNLRVQVSDGGTDGTAILRETIYVNGAPEIYADVPEVITIGAANELATFDASKSFDPNGDLVRIEWDFGDGKDGFGKRVQHQYQKPGTYSKHEL